VWSHLADQLPAIATLVAAFLVYRVGERNSRREAEDRQAERNAATAAREQELQLRRLENERLRGDEDQQRAALLRREEQERYIRFLRAASSVGMHFLAQRDQEPEPTPEDLRREVAAAFEEAFVYAPDDIRGRLQDVRYALVSLESAGAEQFNYLDDELNRLRDAIRDHLA
jgi:hypothetical protein